MELNGNNLILLPKEDSKSNYLSGFWRWVALLSNDEYERALESLYWVDKMSWTPSKLKEMITTFFGGEKPWSVIIPNERLIGVINDSAEIQFKKSDEWGWFRAQIPVTNEPSDPKDDKISLMGLATSFFIREFEGGYVMDFEIFHV